MHSLKKDLKIRHKKAKTTSGMENLSSGLNNTLDSAKKKKKSVNLKTNYLDTNKKEGKKENTNDCKN